MDIIQLYQDFGITFVTEGQHKHVRPGWVNCECPFCTSTSGHEGYHLGFNLTSCHFYCWRCGGSGKYIPRVLSKLLGVRMGKACEIARDYSMFIFNTPVEKKKKTGAKPFILPPPNKTGKVFSGKQEKYLINRGFDPDYIAKTFNAYGAGAIAIIDKIDYKHRIVIPYTHAMDTVSFDTRATVECRNKYLACPDTREKVARKKILYGRPDKWGDVIVIVEGPTDVWRLGVNAAATSGIVYTNAQVRFISKNFKKVYVIFDDEPQAQEQASKLIGDLKFRGCSATNIQIQGDPGGLSQDDANHLMRVLNLK